MQIIKQPNGQYAVFSSVSDVVVGLDMTREEVIDYFIKRAVNRATDDVTRWIDDVDKGYNPGALTYKKALQTHVRNKGNCQDEEWNDEIARRLKEK